MAQPSGQLVPEGQLANQQAPPANWFSVADAAAILGVGERAIRHRCQHGQLQAISIDGRGWYVDPACEPALRLAAGDTQPGPVPAGSEFASLTESQRQRAYRRHELITSYLAGLAHKPAGMSKAEFASRWVETWHLRHTDDKDRTSTRALQRWLAAYRKSGVAGLIDRRGGPREPLAARFSPEAQEYILGMYLKEQRPSIPYIHSLARAVAVEQGWRLPRLRTVQHWIKKRVDGKLLAAGRDPKKFRDRCVQKVKRDWSLVPAMNCWVADHRLLDFFVARRQVKKIDGRETEVVTYQRPWLTLWLDCRSWMPVGWIIDFDAPNAHRVASAFVQAVEKYGVPEHVILDNGKDFRAHEVAGGRSRKSRQKLFDERRTTPIMEALGVTVHWAKPYNPQAKVIENFFGIVTVPFDKTFPTYCGNKPENRPEQLAELPHADEVRADFGLAFVREAFRRYIEEDYALRVPSPAAAAAGKSPLRAFAELRDPHYQPVTPASETLAMLLTRGKRIGIDANGVVVAAFSNWYVSDNPEFERRRGASGRDQSKKIVYRYAVGDPSKVWIFDANTDRFLCVATPKNSIHPLYGCDSRGEDVLADELAGQNRFARETNARVRNLRKGATTLMLDAQRRAGQALGLLDDPKSIKKPAAPRLKLVGNGELDRAAQAGREHEVNRQKRDQSAAAFFREVAAATGTDPAERQSRPVDPLEHLASQTHEETVQNDTDTDEGDDRPRDG